MAEEKLFLLENVRINHPCLDVRSVFDEDEGKFEGTLVMEKGSDAHKLMTENIKEFRSALDFEIAKDKICLRNGNDSNNKEYEGTHTVKASSNKMIPTINKKGKAIKTSTVYAGCVVDALISLWAQNNKWGKRINCNLHAVAFVRDGKPFTGGGPNIDLKQFFGDPDEDTDGKSSKDNKKGKKKSSRDKKKGKKKDLGI